RPAAGPPGRARPGRADHADDPLCVEFAGATRAQPRRSKYSPSFSVAAEAEDTVRKEHTIEPVLPESGANISGVCGLRLADVVPDELARNPRAEGCVGSPSRPCTAQARPPSWRGRRILLPERAQARRHGSSRRTGRPART